MKLYCYLAGHRYGEEEKCGKTKIILTTEYEYPQDVLKKYAEKFNIKIIKVRGADFGWAIADARLQHTQEKFKLEITKHDGELL